MVAVIDFSYNFKTYMYTNRALFKKIFRVKFALISSNIHRNDHKS